MGGNTEECIQERRTKRKDILEVRLTITGEGLGEGHYPMTGLGLGIQGRPNHRKECVPSS